MATCNVDTISEITSTAQNESSPSAPAPMMQSGKRSDYISWDDYFMSMALLSAKRSKDPNTQVGSCIVDNDNRIVAIGYNGFPRNCHDDVFPWGKTTSVCDSEEALNDKKMYVVHAEANAILNKNATNLRDTRLYSTLFPCNECTKLIIQSGIKEVLYISDKYADKPVFRASKIMFDAAGVKYTRFKPKQKQIVLDFDELIKADPTSPFKELKISE